MGRRVFIIVMDSFGIGAMPDAAEYGDEGSDTLNSVASSSKFYAPSLTKLGLFNVDGARGGIKSKEPQASFVRLAELSAGKDTTIGHWEIAGAVSNKPLPTYPNGFPFEIIERFERETGVKTLCNKPYSGTEVIKDYGDESIRTGSLIVYTSADSVFQIAADEDSVPTERLYEYCRIARKILCGKNAVGRVIARPFVKRDGEFIRTLNRHDFSLEPPKKTMLDELKAAGKSVISVGKIVDIFAERGITEYYRIKDNAEGMKNTLAIEKKSFEGLCFVNLVDFDMKYGHRNDVDGYAQAVTDFDVSLGDFLSKMQDDDILIITADHGCDPATVSTDHSREYVFALVVGKNIRSGINLGTRKGFCDISATALEYLGLKNRLDGNSFLGDIIK